MSEEASLNRKSTAAVRAALHDALKPLRFKKKGQLFLRESDDVIHLVALQKSQSSSATEVRLTVNLAVWVPALATVRAGRPEQPSIWGGQWQQRLGFVMPERKDVWWSIRTSVDADRAINEITAALRGYGLPALDKIATARDLLATWDAGMCVGLTEYQRDRFRERLRERVVEQSAP